MYASNFLDSMVIISHMRDSLNIKLLTQTFEANSKTVDLLEQAKLIAQVYARTENAIAVLSDLKIRRSYVYTSPAAAYLGLDIEDGIIDSIWEDELFSRIHKDDLAKKYHLETAFFKFINNIPLAERKDYLLTTILRIKNADGAECLLKHRLLYLNSSENGSVWLTLCLYNTHQADLGWSKADGLATNTLTGERFDLSENREATSLSERQKEILKLIKTGKRSKEIANLLGLSIHTVNRHRQDIFAKLNVTNAIEACKVAEMLQV